VISVRCESCGFVQAERAVCGKCGRSLTSGAASEAGSPGSGMTAAGEPSMANVALAPPPLAKPEAPREKPRGKPVPEPILRVRSVPLTSDLDPGGHLLIEFRCRKCDHYGVLRVSPEGMEKGIEGECGACRRVTPLTRVELASKRMDRREA